jgi:hypothetical protein
MKLINEREVARHIALDWPERGVLPQPPETPRLDVPKDRKSESKS